MIIDYGMLYSSDPTPDQQGWSAFDVDDPGDSEVAVTVPVHATWWGDRGMSMVGEAHPGGSRGTVKTADGESST